MGDAGRSSGGHATTRWSLRGMTALVTGGTRGIGSVAFFSASSYIFLFPSPFLTLGLLKFQLPKARGGGGIGGVGRVGPHLRPQRGRPHRVLEEMGGRRVSRHLLLAAQQIVMVFICKTLVNKVLLSAAMNQMTKNLACEWAKDNIRINSVAPWYIKTKLVEHVCSSLPIHLKL
ncbi:hypothetical protein GW17_00035444 [Ensete ventricosum]|nr:hypothetical protein GW17_00035444 [Ensete ventricosum]